MNIKRNLLIVIVLLLAVFSYAYFSLPGWKAVKSFVSEATTLVTTGVYPASVKAGTSSKHIPEPYQTIGRIYDFIVHNPASLSSEIIITDINNQRASISNLPALTENPVLDQIAQSRLDDMFARQYFAHVSPTNTSVKDTAKEFSFNYIVIGENLAIGDFGSEKDMVEAWMNSPGHRANILNSAYTETGLAVAKGIFNQKDVFLAVQVFAVPSSSCPFPDAAFKAKIDSDEAYLADFKKQIKSIGSSNINEYNRLTGVYNEKLINHRNDITIYNSEVQVYNNCIAKYTN